MAEHNIVGNIGEEIACQMMRKKGFRIVETNWRFGHLEVDIIAINRKQIAFVEVKTRTSTFGNKRPEEYVDELKKRRMVVAANAYIKMNAIEQKPRFDIIGLYIEPLTHKIIESTHLEDAFDPAVRTIGKSTFSGEDRWHHRRKTIGGKTIGGKR
jgi:putative endonuclease